MWVYQLSDGGSLWTVGFFTPGGIWVTDSDWNTREEAAERVAWLNGSIAPFLDRQEFHESLKRVLDMARRRN